MDESSLDVLIIGTGLTESIAAAALAKAGFKVAHIDENHYYGGSEASLSLDELIQWVDTKASGNDPRYTSVTRSAEALPQSRQYSICLCPSVIPSIGPIIEALVSSGVSKYGGFRLLERIAVYSPSGIVRNVPGTKEDVFKSKDMSLIEKRRLMRFLTFAVGDFETRKELEGKRDLPFADFVKSVFSLNDEMTAAIVYSLAYCSTPSDPTGPALHRIRRYLRSAGRYGSSPFLVGHYGGTGDIAQGFCRAAAVNGVVYILGRKITSIRHSTAEGNSLGPPPPRYTITLEEFPDPLTCNVIISSEPNVPLYFKGDTHHLSPAEHDQKGLSIARCIAIIDHPIYFPSITSAERLPDEETTEDLSQSQQPSITKHQALDTAVLVFPPSSVQNGSTEVSATVLITGEGAMSTPKGKWILYLTLPLSAAAKLSSVSAQELLDPYLSATLKLSGAIPQSSALSPSSEPQTPTSTPLPKFTTFYIQHPAASTDTEGSHATYLVPPPLLPSASLPDTPDLATVHAEKLFWETVKHARTGGWSSMREEIETFWPAPSTDDPVGGEEW